MKKSLFVFTLLCALTVTTHAQSLSGVTTSWANLLDACPPDMGIDMCLTDDALFILADAGTSVSSGGNNVQSYIDPTASIYFNDAKIAVGAPYVGAGFNHNLCLVKTDLNGNFKWVVYSQSGDLSSNNGGVVSDGNGGAYVACVIRHTDNLRTEPLRLFDATCNETLIDWRLPTQETPRYFIGLLMHVTAVGAIDWVKTIDVSNAPQPDANENNADATTTAFYISGVETDGSGNFYVAMRYCNPITIAKADGTNVVLTPHNTAGWNGDSQETRGDICIAKFNADGLLTNHLITTGVAKVETSPEITLCGNDLILNFIAAGNGQDDIALDGHQASLQGSEQECLITARLSQDLNVEWMKVFKGEMTANRNAAFQYNRVSVIGNHCWITGMGNFKLISDDGTQVLETATGNIREGFVIKCDLSNGHLIAATTSRKAFPTMTAITGYLGCFEAEETDELYLYGYTWNGMGVILSAIDAATLEGKETLSLITGGSQPTAQQCIATGTTLYTMSRGRDQDMESQQLRPVGSNNALATRDWAICLAKFSLPFNVKGEKATKTGDINGDNLVNVTDVTMLINGILGVAQVDATAADLTGDKQVNVSDVTALINIILG